MILTTTPTLEGQPIKQYLGIVTGETIIGANAIKDLMARPTNFFGERSEEHTSELQSHDDLVCRLLLEKKKTLSRWLTTD